MTDSDSQVIRWQPAGDGKVSCLQLNPSDNVAVALKQLAAGTDTGLGVRVSGSVPKGHKVALCDIAEGNPVIKYAQIIGYATTHINAGEHVHTDNLGFRNTDIAYEFATEAASASTGNEVVDAEGRTFDGYLRADGRVGTRNYIAVLSSVNCSATVARAIADYFNGEKLAAYTNVDGVVAFTHSTGCGMAADGEGHQNLQRVLAGMATHPNIGGVLLVGLGCEVSQVQSLVDAFDMKQAPMLQTMTIQTSGGHQKTLQKGIAHIKNMLETVNDVSRQPCPASELCVALQCGGSDAWSGITANPALGSAVDSLVSMGGTAVLAETPEIYGAEHLLTRRAMDQATGEALIERIRWWEDYVQRNHGSMDNNPSPGNKLGGLTTILEKSLGAVAKGGTTTLRGVYRYGERIRTRGLVFMDTPGYDPASITGEVAGGCNLVVFTTGRGSTYGCKPSPSIKVATNSEMWQRMSDDMDINAGTILTGEGTIASVGQEILDCMLDVASGRPSLSEQHGLGDNEFVPWQIGATM